jgi:hypothetical protein
VYAAVSALAAAVGLVAGGLLVTYASWRWTLIVTASAGRGSICSGSSVSASLVTLAVGLTK